jgi:hypothetical protein
MQKPLDSVGGLFCFNRFRVQGSRFKVQGSRCKGQGARGRGVLSDSKVLLGAILHPSVHDLG